MTTLILIDAENMPVGSWMLVDHVVSTLDGPYYIRIYGNKAKMDPRWVTLSQHRGGVEIVNTPQGKNLADLRMTADGLVMAATTDCERVVVCSSDTDFIHLLEGVQKLGLETVLISYPKSAAGRYRASADYFVPYVEDAGWPGWAERIYPHLVAFLSVVQPRSDGSYLLPLGDLGIGLREHAPWFEPRVMGFRSLSRMMSRFPRAVLVSLDPDGEPVAAPMPGMATHVLFAADILLVAARSELDPFRVRVRAVRRNPPTNR